MNKNQEAIFYGVGVGPGDPELLTLKAQRVLSEATRIYYPVSARTGNSIAARLLTGLGLHATLCPVALALARNREADEAAYRQVAAEVSGLLARGHAAAWVTEGDPSFYSTFGYVQEEVRRRDPAARIEVVPGIMSVQAAAARAGVVAARQGERVAIVTAAYEHDDLAALLDRFATVFVLKVQRRLDALLHQLARLPYPVKTCYLEHLGTAEERVVTDLEGLRGEELPYFSLVILRRGAEGEP